MPIDMLAGWQGQCTSRYTGCVASSAECAPSPVRPSVPLPWLMRAGCSMTRPYTASERSNSTLFQPQWTDRNGDYVFAASPRWPSAKAVASDISIGGL